MTYLALARKWRPKIFSEVMGQSHVVKALSNALTSGRVHHAFLFTGTRGVGKTTLARIFAKSLNCEQGMSAEPCGQCSVCVNVDQGNYIDLIEVDAASRTGIDDMRELLDNVQYAPTQGQYKVYLIDEVHMLSKSSFNALLKTLEEPPEHVKFLFATTDPQKLPVTVLSRCLQFNLKALQPDEIYQQMSQILVSEQLEFEEKGLSLLSRAAEGSLRDALSLLEQAIAQGGGNVSEESVRSMLGTVKAQHMDQLIAAIVENNADKALETINEMSLYAADFSVAIDQLLIELHTVSLAQVSPNALQYKVTDVEKYQNTAAQISAEDVQLAYQIALLGKRDIALAPDYRSGFEMALLRIIAFKPVSADEMPAPVAKRTASNPVEKTIAQAVPANSVSANDATPSSESTAVSLTQDQRVEPVLKPQEKPIVPPVESSRKAPSAPEVAPKTETIVHTPNAPVKNVGQSDYASGSNFQSTPTSYNNDIPPEVFEPLAPVDAANYAAPESNAGYVSQPNPVEHVTPVASMASADEDDEDDMYAGLPEASPSEWAGFVQVLNLNGLVRELAMNMACSDINAEPMCLQLDPSFQYLFNPSREALIINEIMNLRGSQTQVKVVIESSVHETPSERIKRLSGERQDNTTQQLKDDPVVQSVMNTLDMNLVESSVKPK